MRTSKQTRLAAIKAELHRHLPRNTPDSGAIYRCAQLFCEVDDEDLYKEDEEPDCFSWSDNKFAIGPAQQAKYLCIGRNLTREETEGKTQGVEAMNQIARAPAELRPEMWRLGEKERLSSGALSAGRQAAVRLVKQGRLDEAHKELERAARAQAEKEQREEAARRLRPKLTRGARIACALLAQVMLLIKVLGRKGAVSPREVTEIRGAIAKLVLLDQDLARQPQEPAGEEPPPPSPADEESPPSPPPSKHRPPEERPPPAKSGTSGDALDEVARVGAQVKGLRPRQQGLVSQALYDIAAGKDPEGPATRIRRILKRNVPGLSDADADARGVLAVRLLVHLPHSQMRLRALISMQRKVSAVVRAAAEALLEPDLPKDQPDPPPPPESKQPPPPPDPKPEPPPPPAPEPSPPPAPEPSPPPAPEPPPPPAPKPAVVETETPPRKAELLQLLAQVGEGLTPAQNQALQQALENLARSVDQIGGEHIPLYRGITSDDEPRGLWEDGVCQACLSEAGPDEPDEDLRHDPLCHYYRGKRLHVHSEACADNPLCVLLYQGEPPP